MFHDGDAVCHLWDFRSGPDPVSSNVELVQSFVNTNKGVGITTLYASIVHQLFRRCSEALLLREPMK